jgi:hypothetical protein
LLPQIYRNRNAAGNNLYHVQPVTPINMPLCFKTKAMQMLIWKLLTIEGVAIDGSPHTLTLETAEPPPKGFSKSE